MRLRIRCALVGSDQVFVFDFDSGRVLARFLRKLGRGQLRRVPIDCIFEIDEAP